MGDDERLWHGGNLDEARRLFPDAPEPWLDLSTGINPVPYPMPWLPPEVFTRLPSPADLAALERAAAVAYGAANPAGVVAAPGTQALIQLLPRLRPPGRIAIVGPTYAEHAHAWREAGHLVSEAPSLEAALPDSDVVVLVNPNNPDGRAFGRALLTDAAGRLDSRAGWLLVDEAFADLEDHVESLAPSLPAGAVVLRSFGKTFGLAGVRLGFALAGPDLAARLRSALGPWAVSGPAIALGTRALADSRWLKAAARSRHADARRLDDLMRPMAGEAVGGTRLFRLYEVPGAGALFAHFGRHGIWVRRFKDQPSRLRLGLPGGEPGWDRLAGALAGFAG